MEPIPSAAFFLALPEATSCKAAMRQPETVLRVIDALDELTTGGKGGDRADEDQEAMAAAETVRLYCEKRRKTGCCGENCIFDKGNKGALCPLYGSPMGWDRFGGKENG